MADATKRLRLDEILIREGLVSEEQVKEALMRQKAQGGKFGSQLLYHRHIDEAGLVKALAKQFNCEGVVLSNLDIPEIIVKTIPSKVALARKVIPFDYDTDNNVLKVACEDPTDSSLIDELNFVARGKNVKLYAAAELALNTAIARNYLGRDTSLDDNLLLEIPDVATDTGKLPQATESDLAGEDEPDPNARGTVLLVTDEEYAAPLLRSILERDHYQVAITDSADDAIEMLDDREFVTVFIKDTVAGDYIDLIDRLRKISPRTVVRYYDSASSLLLGQDSYSAESDLLTKNLDLLTSLLSTKDRLGANHGGVVGQYVEKLCRRLGLPLRDRLAVVTAGYIHDLAKFYYKIEDPSDYRQTIGLTVKLLESINYSPVVVEMLRSMYIDLKGKYTRRLPIEVLGGNILTIVDLLCDNISVDERLSLDKFDAIHKKFRDLTGKLFLSEVVDAFVVMIKEEVLKQQTEQLAGQVMLYTEEPGGLYSVELRLKSEGFRTISAGSMESFVELYNRSRPDMVVLMLWGETREIAARVDDIAGQGIDFKTTPAFLLVKGAGTAELTPVLAKGIEDAMAADGSLDLLVAKMLKIRRRLLADPKKRSESGQNGSGTRGRLADMNLIDLLQALGPGRRTVKVTLTPAGTETGELTLYLRQGQITFARYHNLSGAEAVYEAVSWSDGTWSVEPVTDKDLPQPNNRLSNESILMEGCRLLDEKTRAGQLL